MSDGTVLIIEDEPHNQMLFRDLLEREGYCVLMAGDAETGIEMARREQPGLILMDIALPGMDGLEATRILNSERQTRDIPIVAVSAHGQDLDAERAMEAGCLDYLVKPICIQRFRQSVASYMSRELAAAA